VLGIFAAAGGAGLLVQDEEGGRLDLLMAYPISRRGLFLARLAALLVVMLGILTLGWIGLALGMVAVAMNLSPLVPLWGFLSLFSIVLLTAALGDAVVHRLWGMRSHVRLGNTLFVHGGLDPHADPDEFLTRPWTIFTEARWAWINHGFLDWKAGFKGTLVVHGHTPPDKHREISGLEDPHLFEGDRLGLDGGSARTGIVTGAEIRDGRYRILKAGTAFANPISSSAE